MDPKRAQKTIPLFLLYPWCRGRCLDIFCYQRFPNSYTEGTQCNIANATNGLNGPPELVAAMGPLLLDGSVLFA